MTDSSKIKLLAGTTVLLILLNVVVIGLMWFGPHHRPGMGPGPGHDRAEVIIHELKFDDAQRRQFEQLKDQHHSIMMAIDEKDHKTHDALFELIKNGQDSTAAADSLINEIAQNKKQIELATYHHMAQVRRICTAEQQKKFDEIIINLMTHRGEGPPPGRP